MRLSAAPNQFLSALFHTGGSSQGAGLRLFFTSGTSAAALVALPGGLSLMLLSDILLSP
jgi:hypothetical protein